MNFQSAISGLITAFVTFYIGCAMIGRADIPIKMIAELQVKALAGTTASWGCPSAFNPKACTEYKPHHYH